MAAKYRRPGVYIKEISKLPPSVAQVETAIPAFIGFTENGVHNGQSFINKPVRINSLVDYERIFGFPKPTEFDNTATSSKCIKIKKAPGPKNSTYYLLDGDILDPFPDLIFRLYYSLQMYFANGGGACYVVSCGTYSDFESTTAAQKMAGALVALKKADEPTLIVFCDAVNLGSSDFYPLYQAALAQAADLRDRFVIIDTLNEPLSALDSGFRTHIGNNNLSYGAAYYPWLKTSLQYYFNENNLKIVDESSQVWFLRNDEEKAHSLYHQGNELYMEIKKQISNFRLVLPPASAIAGVYANVDRTRGVWKAPANVSLNNVVEPVVKINNAEQENLNVSADGKSINAIRTFTGKGVLVWGARTLAGNDNEWRYVNVRRYFNMVEESVKKATQPFVFEPNDANTWTKVRGMIENYLNLKWRDGALQGAKPEQAYFVKVGLGETMTSQDILEGRLIVEIGMAAVRPAEFIILRFSMKMAAS